ncbi:hypothetical protein ACJRO7_017367 [Eucalyptus globulus]|uniref:Uncharacterized protein n=1 Tax=Eucalyptus globulus TaxID=34317 RepID=A0ABD3KX22_EUCGL
MKKEFVQHVLDKKLSDLPEPSRWLHLGCLKVFHTFFNSSNHNYSDTDMIHDIHKALVVPPRVPKIKPLRPLLEQRDQSHGCSQPRVGLANSASNFSQGIA